MITALDIILLQRAQEQLDRPESLREADERGNRNTNRLCVVCDEPFNAQRTALVCPRCRKQGWTPAKCDCGAALHRRDQKSKTQLRNRCAACRAAFRLDNGITCAGEGQA